MTISFQKAKNLLLLFLFFTIASCRLSEPEGVRFYKDQQYEKAFPLLVEDAEKGNSEAQFYLGKLYEEKRTEKNDRKAFVWYQRAAAQNNAAAQYKLGKVYFYGKLGQKADRQIAFGWFLKAAEQGDAEAQLEVGRYYFTGKYVNQNYKEALKWFKKGVEKGKNKEEIYAVIGGMYFKGLGTEKNPSEAARWFEKAAQLDEVTSQLMLASQYFTGQGVLKNEEKARYWAEKAAAQGDDFGDLMLGMLYQYRQEPPDMKQAIYWYEKAAKKGNEGACYQLGTIYERGIGVEPDIHKAHEYYRLAAKGGRTDFVKDLFDFEKEYYLEKTE